MLNVGCTSSRGISALHLNLRSCSSFGPPSCYLGQAVLKALCPTATLNRAYGDRTVLPCIGLIQLQSLKPVHTRPVQMANKFSYREGFLQVLNDL